MVQAWKAQPKDPRFMTSMERQYFVIVTVDETSEFEDSRDVAEYLHLIAMERGDGILDVSAAPDR